MNKAMALLFAAGIFLSCAAETKAAGNAESAGKPSENAKPAVPSAAAPSAAAPSSALAALGLSVFPEPQPVPGFTLEAPDGKTVSISDYKGKYVLLNFWATWCPPCRAEMPSMERLGKRLSGDDFGILAVSVREEKATVLGFLQKTPYGFPIALDPDGKISSLFVGRGIPTTYILDREGRAIAGLIGGREWDSPEVIAAFEELFAK